MPTPGGVQVLIDTIRQNFGLTINHYVEIDFAGFERLVDAVGGIKLWFDAPVRDSHTGLSIPNTGCVNLNGLQAREFARSRYIQYQGKDGRWHSDPTADLGRITRQQIFIRQAIDKAVSQGLGNPLTLNQLVSAGVNNVRLDPQLGAGDLIALGRKFKSFSSNSLIGVHASLHWLHHRGRCRRPARPTCATPSRSSTSSAACRPARSRPSRSMSRSSTAARSRARARTSGGALVGIGFHVVSVGSYPSTVGRTTVLYGAGGQDTARTVARYITGGAALVQDDHVKEGAAVLVTGTDFTTLHSQAAPKGSPDDQAITTATTAAPAASGSTVTTVPATTTTTSQGYATGQPPPGVTCA